MFRRIPWQTKKLNKPTSGSSHAAHEWPRFPSAPLRSEANEGAAHVPRAVPKVSKARRPAKTTLIVSGSKKIETDPSIESSVRHGRTREEFSSDSKNRAVLIPTKMTRTAINVAGAMALTSAMIMTRTVRCPASVPLQPCKPK